MAEILKGAPVANSITEKLTREVAELKVKGVVPALAIVRIGESPDDIAYERAAMKRAEQVGVNIANEIFPEDISEAAFLDELRRINKDDNMHGILIMQPLPKHIDGLAAREMIAAEKDVDGCTQASMAGVFANTGVGFPPCTAEAAMEMLHYYNVDIAGKKAAVIGRSLVIGRPLGMLLMHENATVVNCHTATPDIPLITSKADILIAALGRLHSVTPEYTNPNQVVIDVGINWDEEKQGISGDVDFNAVESVVKAITPVPAGVGSVTTSVLMKHVVEAAWRKASQ
ncbi:MAG: bifunctional 5,10-methylene-tetrahydrofolate dehydrogenase/5,10-methylene-tetrahydrofolate cyclohydrolase [Mogibacterium sp.]|nr:bifunctional 5,10-methylene-tetrahydrofolate dehydrogenase/5,10-methylene-tetrahydrofolate cyclohydrolase [Mogibacterium sp.]